MNNFNTQTTINIAKVFDHHYIESRNLYTYCFGDLPNLNSISSVDGEKILSALVGRYSSDIEKIYHYRWFKKEKKQYEFDTTFILLKQACLIELSTNYCEILHDGKNPPFIEGLTKLATEFKARQRKESLEINLIVKGSYGLELKPMEIKRTKLDLSLYYEDDFKEVDEIIRKRLSKQKDKGIVLLHGLPGTGKTTYLRYLIGRIRKKVLFVSPGVAADLTSPDFIDLLIDNPYSVVIIEDAENIIKDRKASDNAAVSNLLNISDGLLADFLNVQIVCTFNNALTMVDSALMRKGRLIARYEFGKLSVMKAQKLSDYMGYTNRILRPMSIAEITSQDEMEFEETQRQLIGFRRELTEA